MRKVLIISDLVHATPRIPGVAKYLPEFGWQPIILTTPSHIGISHKINIEYLLKRDRVIVVKYHDFLNDFFDKIKIIFGFNPKKSIRRQADKQFGVGSSKASMIRSILMIVKEIAYYPDQFRDWKKPAVKIGNNLIRSENIDAIISSSSPVTSHIIAKELKKQHNIPWIADLRDLWSQNHNYQYSPLRKILDRKLEIQTFSHANALVTVSPRWKERLEWLHKDKISYTITNGYNPEELNIAQTKLTSKFTITYTGQIYIGKQNPSILFVALKELIDDNVINPLEIRVRFFGYLEPWLTNEIKKYGLQDIVKQYARVSKKVALEKQRESQILLLLNWVDYNEKGWYPLKIFEYLAAKRPILSIGGSGNDVVQRLLDETGSGYYSSREDIKRILKEIYSQYKLKGEVKYNAKPEIVSRYSFREKAKIFAQILDDSLKYEKNIISTM